MPVDEGDDERGLPPDPLDRVWFHPSELGAYATAAATGAPVALPRAQRREWGRVAIATALGAVLTAGGFAAAGLLDSSTTGLTGTTTIGSEMAPAVDANPLAGVVSFARSSVVSVRVTGPGGTTAGSGVAFGATRILTAAALLKGGVTVSVATGSGQVVPAQVLGIDPDLDLALLAVEDTDLTPARFARSNALYLGTSVLTLGLESGDHRWVSQGIVAAVDRVVTTTSGATLAGLVEIDGRMDDVVRGGALVDTHGAVVAIVSAAAPGYAIPIDLARDAVDQINASGAVHHGWLGISGADAFTTSGTGVRVTALAPQSPAGVGGLAPGDVIVNLRGTRVTDMADLIAAMLRHKPGDPLTVTAWRGADRMRFQVTLGDRSTPTVPLTPDVG